MPNPLARNTISRIERALDADESTAINEIIQIVQRLAGRAFSISVTELSELIGQDPTITEKVISAANTLGYNPGGASINTISEAIYTVGFEKIRNLAISLLLTENAGQKLNTFEQRDMAALSVCSGMLASTLIGEKTKFVDPELAFVCSSLRNYGKLLMSTFLVEEYREARSLSYNMPDDEAFEIVFGLTPLSLGRHLLETTNLPKSIMASMKAVPSEVLARATDSSEEEIMLAAEFCGDICEATFNDRIGPEQFNDSLMVTINKFQKSFPVSLETVNQALLSVDENMGHLNRIIGIRDDASPATRKLRARMTGNVLPPPPPESRISAPSKKKNFADMDETERDQFAENSFNDAVNSITQKLVPGERVKLKDVYETASKSIMEGLNLENCMVFVREEFDQSKLSARFGFGPLFDKIKNRPLVTAENKDIFSICLARREDILIQDTDAGKIKSVIPEWIHTIKDTSSLIILPASIRKNLFAIIIGTVSEDQSIILGEGDLRRLRLIRVHLATLMQMVEDNEIVAL